MKLAGYLFFGTIVSVENKIRSMLEEEAFEQRPIKFLVFDFFHVNGIDFSAAEAFTRINRILRAKNVHMIMSGLYSHAEVGSSFQNVGLFEEDNQVQRFQDLNSALEYCENGLLEAFYHRRDALMQQHNDTGFLGTTPRSKKPNLADKVPDVPKSNHLGIPNEVWFSSPREQHLHQVAATTIKDQDILQPSKWNDFKQPLPLILQTFQGLTDKNEDFWYRACSFFERNEYRAGTTLYKRGDRPNGFYLLEDGILRAEYDLPQGQYYESIVAGTTCGELPFFSETDRTATVVVEKDTIAWLLDDDRWEKLQRTQPEVAQELLRIGLKLTSERMGAITSSVTHHSMETLC